MFSHVGSFPLLQGMSLRFAEGLEGGKQKEGEIGSVIGGSRLFR